MLKTFTIKKTSLWRPF